MSRFKLNMLRPGIVFCAAIGILLLVGIVLELFAQRAAALIVWGVAGLILLIFIILLAVEQRQDKRQYLKAKKENAEIE